MRCRGRPRRQDSRPRFRKRVAVAAAIAAALTGTAGAAGAPVSLGPERLAGQRIVVPLAGTDVDPALRRAIRAGRVGGVILFSRNLEGVAGARRLTRRLQGLPRPPGLRAPLLVMIDQEGGRVRRLDGPPRLGAGAQAARGPRAVRAAGRRAGHLLRAAGANVDLAPVVDVARPGSVIGADGRAYGAEPVRVARAGVAFAQGLRRTGVAAVAKHFPGFGAATTTTDLAPVRLPLSLRVIRRVDQRPYRALIAHGVPAIMLSTAVYPAIDPRAPAALSRAVIGGELRGRLGFRGVTVTDALDTPALRPAGPPGRVAVRAAAAGSDLLIYASSRAQATAARRAIAGAIRRGRISPRSARAAVGRILWLRERLPRQ